MPNDPVRFDQQQFARLRLLTDEAYESLLDRVRAEFPDRWAEAFLACLALLMRSGFTSDPDQQLGFATCFNFMAEKLPSDSPCPYRLVRPD